MGSLCWPGGNTRRSSEECAVAAALVTLDTCCRPPARVVCPSMEPRIRKVSWRRRHGLLLAEVACMVGLCGLGYINMALALAVLTLISILQKEIKS